MNTPGIMKVPAIGTGGGLAAHFLSEIKNATWADLAHIGSVCVSAATILYILSKLYFLFKNKGKGG